MMNFKSYLNQHDFSIESTQRNLQEQNPGESATEVIKLIQNLDGLLTTQQWGRLTDLIKDFSSSLDQHQRYQVGWNLGGTSFGPPSQPARKEPLTLPPS